MFAIGVVKGKAQYADIKPCESPIKIGRQGKDEIGFVDTETWPMEFRKSQDQRDDVSPYRQSSVKIRGNS